VEAGGAKRFSGGNLGSDDALGVRNAATVHEFVVLGEGDVGGDGVQVGGENEVRGMVCGAGIDIPAGTGGGALGGLGDRGLFDGPAAGGEEVGQEISDGAFVIGG